jgi:copper chaperone CopZ
MEVSYHVPEVHCEACEASIRRALAPLKGIEQIHVDLPGKRVDVRFDERETDDQAIRARIERAGFDVA